MDIIIYDREKQFGAAFSWQNIGEINNFQTNKNALFKNQGANKWENIIFRLDFISTIF